MAEIQDSWREVSSKAEALGLKLKLHLEQEAEADDDSAEEDSTRATLEDFGRKLQDAFDSLGVAAKDPAVQADFKDMGALVKDAIADTFSSVSTDVGDAMKKATRRGDEATAGDPPGDPAETANGDVSDSSNGADDN